MIGDTIGNFKVVARLGRGGMGEVFVGEQVSIQTRVAIKILHREISSETDHVQRFFNEARIVSRIKHAGIVKIFDVGFHRDHAYLVMELLEGDSLSRRIEQVGRLSATQIADFGRQIASALAATHDAGVIHRDLKPDNIFITSDQDLARRERVKLLDFGIAKLSGTLVGMSPRTVGTMGTPAYMAPEQWGDSAKIDWRADAYSLGCVAFEMACGRPPFDVSTIADACARHLNTPPPSPRSLSPDLPPAVDQLILQLLAKDPAARGASMAEIARAFEALGGGDHAPAPLAATITSDGIVPPPSAQLGSRPTPTPSASRPEITDSVAAPSPRRSRLPFVIGGTITVAGVIAAILLTRSGELPSSAAAPAATAPAPPPVTAAPAPAPAPGPAPAPVEVAPPATEPTAVTPKLPSNKPSITKHPETKRPTVTKKPDVKPPATSCDPPYTLDATGKRIYKKECLK